MNLFGFLISPPAEISIHSRDVGVIDERMRIFLQYFQEFGHLARVHNRSDDIRFFVGEHTLSANDRSTVFQVVDDVVLRASGSFVTISNFTAFRLSFNTKATIFSKTNICTTESKMEIIS